MSSGPPERAEPSDRTIERAIVRPGRGLDTMRPESDQPIEGIVDRVLEDHEAVMASLHEDVRVPLAGVPEGPASVLRRERAALAALKEDLAGRSAVRDEIESGRRERERLVADLRPTEGPVFREDPIVTRSGVLRVEADFDQAQTLGPLAASRLFAHGIRTARAFIEMPLDEAMRVTGAGRAEVQRARDDLRLERLSALDAEGADLVRLAGVHSLRELATRDPVVLARRLAELKVRHRFTRFPEALASEAGVARLVSDARTLSGVA